MEQSLEKEELILCSGLTKEVLGFSYMNGTYIEIVKVNCPTQSFDDILSGKSPLLSVVGVNEIFGEYYRLFIRIFSGIIYECSYEKPLVDLIHVLPIDIKYYTKDQVYQFLNFVNEAFVIGLVKNMVKEMKTAYIDIVKFNMIFTFKFTWLKQKALELDPAVKKIYGFDKMVENVINYIRNEKEQVDYFITSYYNIKKDERRQERPEILKDIWTRDIYKADKYEKFLELLISEGWLKKSNNKLVWNTSKDKNLHLAGLILACQLLGYIDKPYSAPIYVNVLMNTFNLHIGDNTPFQSANFIRMKEQYNGKYIRHETEVYYFEPFLAMLKKL